MAGQFCEYCGAPLNMGNKFCESCGRPVANQGTTAAQTPMVMCPSCGAANPAGTMFCSGCGMPIDDEAYEIYNYSQVSGGAGIPTNPNYDGWGHTPPTSYPPYPPTPPEPPKPPVLPYVLAGLAVAIVVAGAGIYAMRDRIFGGGSSTAQEEVADDTTGNDEDTTSSDEDEKAAEEEAKRKEEEEAKRKEEEEAKRKEEEEEAKRQAEEEAKRKAEEEAAAAAAQADQSFHDTLVSYYTKLPSYDSRIKDVASTWNADHFSGRDYKSQTAYGLESEIYNDYIALSSMTVPTNSSWGTQHSLLVQTYEAAYGRIHTMCESWRLNMQYSDPQNHQSEINYPIVSQNDSAGINYDKRRYDELYPQINL